MASEQLFFPKLPNPSEPRRDLRRKMSFDQVQECRSLYNDGWTQTSLASRYRVSQSQISLLLLNKIRKSS